MPHWSDKYLALVYDEKAFDCAHFVERVRREQFQHDLQLPHEHESNYRAQARQIEAEKLRFAEPTELPLEGDAVLIKSRGYFEHLGILCLIAGERWVLHNWSAYGKVCRHRIRDLRLYQLELEGIYRWI